MAMRAAGRQSPLTPKCLRGEHSRAAVMTLEPWFIFTLSPPRTYRKYAQFLSSFYLMMICLRRYGRVEDIRQMITAAYARRGEEFIYAGRPHAHSNRPPRSANSPSLPQQSAYARFHYFFFHMTIYFHFEGYAETLIFAVGWPILSLDARYII